MKQIRSRYKVEFWICILTSAIFLFLATQQSFRVGDGSEYVAMYYSFATDFQPWSSLASFAAYDNYLASGEILGLVDSSTLKTAFPPLASIVGQWDFNHFWLYSLLAYLCQITFTLGMGTSSAKSGFLILHLLLTCWLMIESYKKFSFKGLAASILLVLSSPILWFTFAIHTEYFTFALTTVAFIYILSGERLKASLCLAIASTQNPSFLVISLAALIYDLISRRKRNWLPKDWILICFVIGIGLLHPSYYLIRYGAATPQSLAGGLSFGGNIKYVYIWFLDPDLGLFPNWPLSFAVLILLALLWKYGRNSFDSWPVLPGTRFEINSYILIYLAVSIVAQSGTTNLNSGATPGVARYALWYICLFFPAILFFTTRLSNSKKQSKILVAPIISVFLLLNIVSNHPFKNEDYSRPSAIGLYFQRYFSRLYSPPPEVFAERYSGFGEAIWTSQASAVLGPDCRRVLILKDNGDFHLANNFECKVSIFQFSKIEDWTKESKNKDSYQFLESAKKR